MKKPKFIAEVASNHNQDAERALAFVDRAAALGFDAVKFQLFRIDRLFAPEILARSRQHRARKDWELPLDFLPELAGRCTARGIDFACTPFDLEAVAALEPYVAFYKIASYELLWHDLLKACAGTGKPVVISTGNAIPEEIGAAVDCLREAGCANPTVLHCSSAYPTSPAAANLAAMETIRGLTGCPVGWSDHTRSEGVITRAIHRWGAEVIELHFDLDPDGVESPAGHCWLPAEIERLFANLAQGLAADGDGVKQPNDEERADREWRADPVDGLRPMKHLRSRFTGDETS